MSGRVMIGRNILLIASLVLVYACNTSRPFYKNGGDFKADLPKDKQVKSSIFLIGDTGAPELEGALNVLTTLQYHLEQASDSSAIIFLGDNIYPDGMPPKRHKARARAEASMRPALEMLKSYSGEAFFIPGNHDWRYGRAGVQAQEQFVENYNNKKVQFVPDNGCPGPNGFAVGSDWYLITLDSEWWINESIAKDKDITGCARQSRAEVIDEVEALVEEHSDKQILLAFHHPLYSNGNHGGYYSVKDHLFPLTNLVNQLYVPLPLLGSAYPLSRKLGVSDQDLSNKRYQLFKKEILEAVEDHEINFLVSGHEHSLSFYEKEKANRAKEGTNYFIVSGSGSKRSFARRGYDSEFVYSQKGFAKLISYQDGSVAVEFWISDEHKRGGKLVYAKQLIAPTLPTAPPADNQTEIKSGDDIPGDSIATIAAGPNYKAGGFKRFMWGDHYRDAWTTNIDVPVMNMEKEKSGLEVLAKTGGVQTITIIVEDSTGRKHVMRSVQKNPKKSLPEELQETFVTEIAQDQTSASHPYGGLIAPTLARAAGVYQNTPELKYISENSPLNISSNDRLGTLITMEEFISKEWFNQVFEKEASNVIGSDELWDQLREGSAATVDQRQLVRSRIFDMYIGDWDRHEGQWFWAKTETDSLPAYQPIPIDRDNAFYKSDGVIMGLARLLLFPKFQLFGDDIQNIKGMNLNAQYFDRWFMNELPKEEWIGIAEKMQQSLTDSVITSAVEEWPEPITRLNGATFIEKLKTRREKLPDFARRYYDLLSRSVNVYGSDKVESFVVHRLPNGETSVEVYRIDEQKPNQRIYQRVFKVDETKEVRLYGFDGADHFDIDGQVEEAIKIRIIGGEGEDIIRDQSKVASRGRQTLVYDTPQSSRILSAGEIKDKTSANPRVNRYDKRGFNYHFLGPLIASGFNENDGVFVGGGVHIRRHGFRKKPFASDHRITGKMATLTSSFTFNYEGIFTERVGRYDLGVQIGVRGPNYSSNFFGLGNETERTHDDNGFYGYPYNNLDTEIELTEWYNDLLQVRLGSGYEYLNPLSIDNRFVTSPAAELPESAFRPHHFATIQTGFKVSTVDSKLFPKNGYKFNLLSEFKLGLNERSKTFNRLNTETSLFYTFRDITTTVATRVGFATNIGSFNFFQANTLGGQTFSGTSGNLRGYVRDRFAGRTSLFHNTELRTKLFNIESYYLPASMGVLGFVDEGRVWARNEHSKQWHLGYGGGIWISPLQRAILTVGYARSKEDGLFTLSLGFTF